MIESRVAELVETSSGNVAHDAESRRLRALAALCEHITSTRDASHIAPNMDACIYIR